MSSCKVEIENISALFSTFMGVHTFAVETKKDHEVILGQWCPIRSQIGYYQVHELIGTIERKSEVTLFSYLRNEQN